MYRFWSVFFALLPIACTAFFGYSWYSASLDPMNHWWFPENVSSVGGEIDGLFMLILGATTFTFLLCNVLLVVYMWKYAADKEEHDEQKSQRPWAHNHCGYSPWEHPLFVLSQNERVHCLISAL